jgi:hypothetical protein
LHISLHGPETKHRPTRVNAGGAVFPVGVSDGTRTRDIQDHNLVIKMACLRSSEAISRQQTLGT